ncbi:spermidine/putrescine ABC transporter ATP-binding protein [Bacillus sp. BPN334]|nr:spermidine/putrescine ABC transporter ATP-binding protein [Bacillus sp. BPN334]
MYPALTGSGAPTSKSAICEEVIRKSTARKRLIGES